MADGRGVAFLPWGSAVVWCARPAHQATLPPAGTTDGQPVLRLVGPGGRPEEPRETEDISQPTRGDSGPLDTAATVRGPRIRQSAHAESPDPEELKRLVTLAAQSAALRGADAAALRHCEAAWQDVAHALFNAKEFLYMR